MGHNRPVEPAHALQLACALAFTLLVLGMDNVTSEQNTFEGGRLAQESVNHSRPTRNVKSVIYIGVLLAEGDEQVEPAFRAGVQAANQVLAQSELLQNHQIEPLVEIVPKDNAFAATQQACKLMTRGIVALFGPNVYSISQVLLSLSNRFGIPYIETHWSVVTPSGTYVVSMHPRIQSFGLGLYEYLMQVEKWRRMTIIANRPQSLLKFSTLVNSFEGIVKLKSWDSGSTAARVMLYELSSTSERNFLIDIPVWQVRDFLVMAFVHNMTGSQYTFFFTDWDVSLMDLTPFKIGVGAQIKTISILTKARSSASQSQGTLVKVNPSPPPPPPHTGFVDSQSLGAVPILTTQFGVIYDSILLLAHGLVTVTKTRPLLPQKLSCERPPGLWPLGLSLINAMKAVPSHRLNGFTGPFRFDKEGFRTLFDLTTLELTEGGFVANAIWNIDERMKVAKKSATRPQKKLPKEKGIFLKVTTLPDAPFMIPIRFDAYGKPLDAPDAWTGYCKELLDGIASEVGFNYTIHITPDRQYGSGTDLGNGTVIYNGIMGELIREVEHDHCYRNPTLVNAPQTASRIGESAGRSRKEADMAVAAFTITYEREKLVDFSTPWMTVGGSILFTRPKSQKPSLFSFLQPLSAEVWLYVMGIYFTVCLCMFIAARLSPYEWVAPHPCDDESDVKKNQFTLLNSFYYYMSAFLNQGTELAPQATSTRILTASWWFFGLIILATYTANLAAFLTVENTKSPIESADDLANQEKIHYGTLKSGSSRDFFRTSAIPTFKKMGDFMDRHPDAPVVDTQTGISRVLQGNYAFILESSWNEYYVQRDCRLMQVGALLDSKGYGIGFPQGSPWRDPISKAILKMQNAQTLANLKRKWWNEFNITEPCSLIRESSKAPSPLGVEHVGGVFIMLLVGFFIGFFVAIVEFFIATRDLEKKTAMKGMWRELKFAARCLTTSKRLKSEVHKLPRSRSNLKLIASIPNNLNTLNTRPALPEYPMANGTGESSDPLLKNDGRGQRDTVPTAKQEIPQVLGSPEQSDQSAATQLEYPSTVGYRWPGEVNGKRAVMIPRGVKSGATGGQELWQMNPH